MIATSGIYAITHTASGRLYVGSAVNVGKRWGAHKSQLQRGCHDNQRLQNGWNAHGAGAYEFSVVEAVADTALLIEREQWHMDRADPFYNICRVAGSCLGKNPTAASRARMSAGQRRRAPHSAETRARMSAAQKGRKPAPVSAETRAKLSAAMKGHTRNLGRKRTHEQNAANSARQKGKKRAPEHVAASASTNTGKKRTPEQCAAISAGKSAARARRIAA